MFLQRFFRARKPKTLDALAQAYRCEIVTSGEHERFFAMNVHNRDFKITERRQSRGSTSGDSLMTSTPLESRVWKLHAMHIQKGEWRGPADSNLQQMRSDDPKFDDEFSVSESGDAVPEQWFNKEVRSDVRALFQLPLQQVALTAQAGVLTHRIPLQGNELSPRASQELLRRFGWLASALDRAGSGGVVVTNEENSTDEYDVVVNVAPNAERGTKFKLSKNTLSIGGDYTIEDASGCPCYSVAGKLRFATTFSVLDAQKNVLYSGREHVWNLDRKFVISRDDIPHATMLRRVIGDQRKILSSPDYRYEVEHVTGEKFEASGMFTHRWKLTQGENVIAAVATDGHASDITIPHPPRDLPFVLAVIVAIVRLNPPSRHAIDSN
jgi:uncharacterized protein YxjI